MQAEQCAGSCGLHCFVLPAQLTSKPSDATAANMSCPCCCAVRLDLQQPFCHCPADYVSCPSCGRTLFDLQEVTESIRQRTGHLPGEMCRPARLPSAFVLQRQCAGCVPFHLKRRPSEWSNLFGCCMLYLRSTAFLAGLHLPAQSGVLPPSAVALPPLEKVPCWQWLLTCSKQRSVACWKFEHGHDPHRLQAKSKLPLPLHTLDPAAAFVQVYPLPSWAAL